MIGISGRFSHIHITPCNPPPSCGIMKVLGFSPFTILGLRHRVRGGVNLLKRSPLPAPRTRNLCSPLEEPIHLLKPHPALVHVSEDPADEAPCEQVKFGKPLPHDYHSQSSSSYLSIAQSTAHLAASPNVASLFQR